MFRIPFGAAGPSNSTRPPVFLQHGLLDSSFTWILNLPYESLSYIFADAGFDVWMGNNRGDRYSLGHTTLNVKDKAFWEFSWDEMAKYDIPAQLDYVLNATGYSRLSYVGHSQGTIQMFAALVSQEGIRDKLDSYVALGPVATVAHVGNIGLKVIADLHVDTLFAIFGEKEFLPSPTVLKTLFIEFCSVCETCCSDVIELICGPHEGAFNESRMPVMASHEPGGTSVRNMQHWGQAVRDGQFQHYDYGIVGNLEHYGQSKPPPYDLTLFPSDLPTYLFSGGEDLLADPTDVANLLKVLPSTVLHEELPTYAHLDFCWDMYAYKEFYPALITFVKQNLSQ